jgi:uroporphyrinogen-III decarboxylase
MQKHDWKASIERITAVFAGEVPDRVPYDITIDQAPGTRIAGLTVKELLSSPKVMAERSIEACELLGVDLPHTIVLPYAGPMEAFAIAKVNGKAKEFIWQDYDSGYMNEGKVIEKEEDIENLELPDHMKVEPWPTVLKACAIMKEKIGMAPGFSTSLTWSHIQLLRGSRAYLDIRENPDLLLKLCEKLYQSQMDLFHAYTKIIGPITAIRNCQYAFNRQMLSFDDAWKFEGQFVVRFCKETNLPLFVHNCGFEPYWHEMIDKFLEEGIKIKLVNGSHPLDLDWWVRFRQKYPEIVIAGASIYVNAELTYGTPEDVMKRVKDNIDKLAPLKRLIIHPQCCPGWRVPLANLFAVGEAVRKYGVYPINGQAG